MGNQSQNNNKPRLTAEEREQLRDQKRAAEREAEHKARRLEQGKDMIAQAGGQIVGMAANTALQLLFRWLLSGNGGEWYTHRQPGDLLGTSAKGWAPNTENFVGYYQNSQVMDPQNNRNWALMCVSPVQVERFTRGLTTYTDAADTANGYVTLINELFDALQATNGSSRNPRYTQKDVGRFVHHARVGAVLLCYYASQLRAVKLEHTNDTTLPQRMREALNCDAAEWNIRTIDWPSRVAALLRFAQSFDEIFNVPAGFIKRDRWIQTGWFCDAHGTANTVRVCLPDEMYFWDQNDNFISLGALARDARTPAQMEEMIETYLSIMRARKVAADTLSTDLKSLYGARTTYSELVEDFSLSAAAQCAAPFVVDQSFNLQYHNAKFLATKVITDATGVANQVAYPTISAVGDYGIRIQMGVGRAPKDTGEICANVAGLLLPTITSAGQYLDIDGNADYGSKLKASLWAYTWRADASNPDYVSAVLDGFAIDYLVARQPLGTAAYKYTSGNQYEHHLVRYDWIGTYVLLYNVRALASYSEVITNLIPNAEMEHAPELTLFDIDSAEKHSMPYVFFRCLNRAIIENFALKDAQRQCVKSYYHIPTLIKRSKATPNVKLNGE
jgi:hypothetical protein